MKPIVENNLETFFSGLSATLNSVKEVQKLYNPIMAFEFNPFNRFWWLDENKVSDIIAFFLNPKESHAQGNIFLKLFLEDLELKVPLKLLNSGTSIEVKTNYQTIESRWIDIVIKFGENEYFIGIENKIHDYTRDQYKQVFDYCTFLKEISKGNFILFYLAPKGKSPSEESITESKRKQFEEEGHLKIINYQENIIDLVNQWFIHCRAERVRVFLMEFHQHLKHIYLGETFMEEQNIITDYIVKNNNYVEIARSIFNSCWAKVKLKLIEQFKIQIVDIFEEMKNEIESYKVDDNFGNENTGFYFFPKGWKEYCIGFAFDTNWFHDFYFGISKQNQSSVPLDDIWKRNDLLSEFNEDPTIIWPRSKYFEYYRNWDDYSPVWNDISDNNTMKLNIKKEIEYILNKLKGQDL